MTREEINGFCASLRAATHVVQWGGADVWKVGGKVFAIAGWDSDAVVFKASDMAFEVLRHEEGIRPAPYMASRGLKWLQHYGLPNGRAGGLSDAALQAHITASYDMVFAGLPKKKQAELRA
ncbi:MmcQ/YjbR family DNA-binding protein [Pseudorhodobacter sp.]|uniref:MmcQ/YjbR family DNA-binding protein n=1 Tax=Pseudorhodobacter sp. TaxID=1934400 RepID=UPI002AFE320B|nr:MmcQ/YjbR family DNA-binding protein [Pseudorhodobacter sp.]